MKKWILLLFFLLSGCSLSRGIELTDLKEKTDKEILKSHGKPTIVRQEMDKKMWVYREDECTFLVFFDASGMVQFAESRGNCPEQK